MVSLPYPRPLKEKRNGQDWKKGKGMGRTVVLSCGSDGKGAAQVVFRHFEGIGL